MAYDQVALPRVEPRVPDSADQPMAQAVDSVFIQLQSVLNDFQAAEAGAVGTTGTIAGVPANHLVSVFNTVFFQPFDNDIEGYWTLRSGTSGLTYPSNGQTGGSTAQKAGEVFYEFPQNIAYDPSHRYRIRARVKATGQSAGDTIRVGVQGIAADGTTVVARDGSSDPLIPHRTCCNEDMSSHASGDFVDFTGYFTGLSIGGASAPGTVSDPKPLQNNVRYIRPFFWLNATGTSTDMEIDFIALEVMTGSAEIDVLDTVNAPAEAGAETTTGKSLTVLSDVVLENIKRSAFNPTGLDVILAQMDDAGNLYATVLQDDGSQQRTIIKGHLSGSAQDGDTVTFDSNYQNVPAVTLTPTMARIFVAPSSGLMGLERYLDTLPFDDGGPPDLWVRLRPSDLGVDGFDLVAELVETAIVLSESTETFGAGTLTTEGATLEETLNDDAYDDEYRVRFDVDLDVTSTSNQQNHDDNFPAGTLSTVAAQTDVTLTDTSNDDSYDVRYGVDLAVKADQTTNGVTDNFPVGDLTVVGDTKAVTLSSTARDGIYTATFNVDTTGVGTCSVQFQVYQGGSWVTKDSDSYVTGFDGLKTLQFTDLTVVAGDQVRLRLSAETGTAVVDPTTCTYTENTYFAQLDVDVKVWLYDGTWNLEGTYTHTVTDNDGTGTTLVASFTRDVTQVGATQARVELDSITWSGTRVVSFDSTDVNPNDVKYVSGDTDTATLSVEVAVDSKDGAAAWVERAVKTYVVTDTNAVQDTLSEAGQQLSFVDPNIVSGDKVRVRLKSVDVTGSAASSGVTIDPVDVKFNTGSGTETTHSMTPNAGNAIGWQAVAT